MSHLAPTTAKFKPSRRAPHTETKTRRKGGKRAAMQHVLLVGNPGVGKSTLLNALLGEVAFKSGVKVGSGLTEVLQTVENNGVLYSDTPGLDDALLRTQAAAEISRALCQGGECTIIFVVTLEAGRIRPADLSTIDVVLHALAEQQIDMTDRFSVIVNKCSSTVLNLLDHPDNIDILRAHFSRTKRLGNILFFPDIASLIGANNMLLDNPVQLRNFVHVVSSKVRVPKSRVLRVDVSNFETKVGGMMRMIEDLQREIDELRRKKQLFKLKELLSTTVRGFCTGAGGAFIHNVAFARAANVTAATALETVFSMAYLRARASKWYYGWLTFFFAYHRQMFMHRSHLSI